MVPHAYGDRLFAGAGSVSAVNTASAAMSTRLRICAADLCGL
jgi:hypothetical protein